MKKQEKIDLKYMKYAMELAERGRGWVNPNPMVGALLVKDDRIISEGWHEYYGDLHAERNAFRECRESVEGATLYVTLEPCCHFGKTPPCTEVIIRSKIARVVIGITDPNPLVAGKGIELLQKEGIEVVTGVLEEELKEQNKVFLKYITTRRPWVALKTAMTLDGKIATCSGDSKWITGEEARERVHHFRREFMGVMVGIGTVLADDPLLNCRLEGEVRQPVRLVVDSNLRMPFNSRLVATARTYRTIVVCTPQADKERQEALERLGIEILRCEAKEGRVDLEELMRVLGEMGIDSILLEGGGELNYSFLRQGLVDEVCTFIAPKLIGGRDAKTPLEGTGWEKMYEAMELGDWQVEQFGKDILLRARVLPWEDKKSFSYKVY